SRRLRPRRSGRAPADQGPAREAAARGVVGSGEPLRVERDGPLLRITLARPERRNALDAGLIAAMTKAFGDVGDARAVVLAGEGDSFCAGADVEWMRGPAGASCEGK